MGKNVKEYLAFKRGEIKMPEHLAIRKELSGTLFKNKILESLTRTGIYTPIILQMSVSSFLFRYGIRNLEISLNTALIAFVCGFILWTLDEYNVHRFLYHAESNSKLLLKIQHNAHGIHHQYPMDATRLAMPSVPGLFLSGTFFLIFWLVNSTYVFVFFPGFMLGYLTYISLHFAQHRVKSSSYPPFKALWKHHQVHHYVDPYVAHGVSTRFWDFIFGTMPKNKVPQPK